MMSGRFVVNVPIRLAVQSWVVDGVAGPVVWLVNRPSATRSEELAMTGTRSADVERSQRQWRSVRSVLNSTVMSFSAAAGELYPDVTRVDGTGLLCRPAWLPDAPIGLDQLRLGWVDNPPAPIVTASGTASLSARSLNDDGDPFETYADAVGALDRPALFENRPIYRLLGAGLSHPGARLDLTIGRYFDAMGAGEALAHEFATATREHGQVTDLRALSLRSAIGDPCDLSRRPVSVAITVLTLRNAPLGGATFLVHWRDPAKVTHAAGMCQVMPVGIFQPADDNPTSLHHDLNLWYSMVREFSEELLGSAEDYARFGSPVEYAQWDFYRRPDRSPAGRKPSSVGPGRRRGSADVGGQHPRCCRV